MSQPQRSSEKHGSEPLGFLSERCAQESVCRHCLEVAQGAAASVSKLGGPTGVAGGGRVSQGHDPQRVLLKMSLPG